MQSKTFSIKSSYGLKVIQSYTCTITPRILTATTGRGKVVKGNSTSAEVFVGEPWVRLPSGWSDETLWAIDKSMCALDPGNMVV